MKSLKKKYLNRVIENQKTGHSSHGAGGNMPGGAILEHVHVMWFEDGRSIEVSARVNTPQEQYQNGEPEMILRVRKGNWRA